MHLEHPVDSPASPSWSPTLVLRTFTLGCLATAALAQSQGIVSPEDVPASARVHVTPPNADVPGRTILEAVSSATPAPGAATKGQAITQMPGFPRVIGSHPSFSPWRNVVFADLDQNGRPDIVTSSTDSRIYAMDHTGADLPGFPVPTIGWCQYVPSVADLDGDGDLEIVQFTRGLTSGGRLYAVDHLGQVLPGFPISFGNANLAGAPTLADLDDDGDLEILVPQRASNGLLHVVEADGSLWTGGFPLILDHVPTGSPAVADVDQDGDLEIAYLSYNSAYLLDTQGVVLPGWPKQLPGANFSYQSPAFFDADQDGDLEIALGAHQSSAGYYLFHHDGSSLPGWPKFVGTWTYCPPTIADLEGDGSLEVMGGREGTGVTPSATFWAWDIAGNVKPGFPLTSGGAFGGGTGGPITTVDIDGDGQLEVFSGHNGLDGGLGYIYGVDALGVALPGFPLRPQGFTYMNGATFGDTDADGDLELCALSVDSGVVYINLYDLPGSFTPATMPWAGYHQDNSRGGLEGGGRKLFVQGDVTPGGTPRVTIVGEPGAIASVGMSLAINRGNTPFGWKYTGQLRQRTINNVVIPPSGQIEVPFPIPPNPVLLGTTFYFQGLSLLGGQGQLTNLVGRTVQ